MAVGPYEMNAKMRKHFETVETEYCVRLATHRLIQHLSKVFDTGPLLAPQINVGLTYSRTEHC